MRGLNFSFFKISISLFVLKYIATINLVHLKMIHVCVCEKQHEGRGMTVSLFTKLVTIVYDVGKKCSFNTILN